MKKLLLILLLLIVLVVGGCSQETTPTVSYGTFEYSYDEVHGVSIWTWRSALGGGIAVLPGKDVQNPFEPMSPR